MNSLYQRLKELDPNTFERFCFQLLKERHPGIEIHHLDGTSGDHGADVFAGEIDSNPTIWQCKSFANGIGESQKEKIRESLRQAVKYYSPRTWVLCISVDLDEKAHRWFENLKKSYAAKVKIGLMDASHIVRELIQRRTLCSAYFPGAVLDTTELRALMTKTSELNDEELASLNAENVRQHLQRLKDHDERLTCEITFGGDRGVQPPPLVPGLLVSISDQNKRIDVYARDTEALKLSPPKVNFTIIGHGVEKWKSFVETGKLQEFGSDELTNVNSDFDFITGSGEGLTPLRLQVGPPDPKKHVFLRVTFGNAPDVVIYEFMEFVITRAGSEEVELLSISEVPCQFSLILRTQKRNWYSYNQEELCECRSSSDKKIDDRRSRR